MPPPARHAAPTAPRRLPRRLLQLYAGLALYGASMALLVRSDLGVMPWDVLHQGIAERVDRSLGTVTIAVGALVLLAWVPLRQRPGLGTVSNVLVIGLAVDAVLQAVPEVSSLVVRVGLVPLGIVLNAVGVVALGFALGGTLGFATAAYALLIGPLVHVLLPRLEVG